MCNVCVTSSNVHESGSRPTESWSAHQTWQNTKQNVRRNVAMQTKLSLGLSGGNKHLYQRLEVSRSNLTNKQILFLL